MGELKVKGCPFCGKMPSVAYHDVWPAGWQVICTSSLNECPRSFGNRYETKAAALREWNKREEQG